MRKHVLHDRAEARSAIGGTAAASNGVATFNSLSIDRNGAGFVLQFAAANMAGTVDSSGFVIQGVLAVQHQPSTTIAGASMSDVVVGVVDIGGSVIGSARHQIATTTEATAHTTQTNADLRGTRTSTRRRLRLTTAETPATGPRVARPT